MESRPAHRFLASSRPAFGPASRGFSLIEMLVVLAIIVLITAIVINGQSTYNESLILTDTAYTVATSLREAQSLGLSSRSSGGFTNVGYGVHFAGTAGYTIFADTKGAGGLPAGLSAPSSAYCVLGASGTPEHKPGNCRYDAGQDQTVQTYTFERNFTINDLCLKAGSGPSTCEATAVDIIFMRPETRAVIVDQNGNASYTCAEIRVAAPTGGVTRVVRVSQLGEISVGQQCS